MASGSRFFSTASALLVIACIASGCSSSTAESTDQTTEASVIGPVLNVLPKYVTPEITAAPISCDLDTFFPDAAGAAGGWTTGWCASGTIFSSSQSNRRGDLLCAVDEAFASYVAPTPAPVIGSHCRAVRAMDKKPVYARGGGIAGYAYVPASPPARGVLDRDPPKCPACFTDPFTGKVTCPPGERHVNQFVICPWQDSYEGGVGQYIYASTGVQKTDDEAPNSIGYCNKGSTNLSGIPTSSTYAVVFAYDPLCNDCITCDDGGYTP